LKLCFAEEWSFSVLDVLPVADVVLAGGDVCCGVVGVSGLLGGDVVDDSAMLLMSMVSVCERKPCRLCDVWSIRVGFHGDDGRRGRRVLLTLRTQKPGRATVRDGSRP
jgi:hypothetical protein